MLKITGKSLIFGDLHAGIKNDSLSRLNLTIKTIEEILKICEKENVKNIIFLGDWFESRTYIHSATITISNMLIELLAQNHNVIIIVGNHDLESNVYNDISPLITFSNIKNVNVIHNKPTTIFIDDKRCLCVPWGFTVDDTIDGKFDFIFGHFTVSSHSIRYNKVICNITDNSEYVIAKNNDVREFAKMLSDNGVLFSGHVHHRTEHNYRSSRIIFVGSPLELNFGEIYESHGVYILDNDNFLPKFIEIVDIPKHKYLKYSDCFDDSGKIKSKSFFKQFNNSIIKRIIDIDLNAEQQSKLDEKINNLEIYDFVKSDISYNYNSVDNENNDKNSSKLSIESYIDIVFGTMNDDIFETAYTNKELLKVRFLSEYYEKINN